MISRILIYFAQTNRHLLTHFMFVTRQAGDGGGDGGGGTSAPPTAEAAEATEPECAPHVARPTAPPTPCGRYAYAMQITMQIHSAWPG